MEATVLAVSAECRAKSFPFGIKKSTLLALYHCVNEVMSALSVNFAPKFTCPTPSPACRPHLSALPSPKPTHLTLNHFQILPFPSHSFNPRESAHRWLHFRGGPIQKNNTLLQTEKKKDGQRNAKFSISPFFPSRGRAMRCTM